MYIYHRPFSWYTDLIHGLAYFNVHGHHTRFVINFLEKASSNCRTSKDKPVQIGRCLVQQRVVLADELAANALRGWGRLHYHRCC